MSKRCKDDLGRRMKEYYEQVPKTRLMRRTPVAIRIDGKAFHTYTKGFKKPFDDVLMKAMQQTTKYLCENIQGCVLGYTQSDEITLILCDYQTLSTSAWYDYEVQKLCSVSASMATMAFNREMALALAKHEEFIADSWNPNDDELRYEEVLARAVETGAMFDARCFNVPVEEVTNLVFWRQLDSAKNSVQLLGRKYFSVKELHGKHAGDIKEMLMSVHGVDWNQLPAPQRVGSCVVRSEDGGWAVDKDIPDFKGDGRDYIEKLVHFDDEEQEE